MQLDYMIFQFKYSDSDVETSFLRVGLILVISKGTWLMVKFTDESHSVIPG